MPHATVRFWDLRYFVGDESRRLLPASVAVNSPIARAELLHGGYPPESLHDAEALMYVRNDRRLPSTATRRGILVLGELEVVSTQRYLDWVVRSAGNRSVTFKPHPLIAPELFSFDHTKVTVATASADALIASAEEVVLGASGTAALEAIALGVPVVAVLNPRELDLSVVDSHPLVRHVATENELLAALHEPVNGTAATDEVFFLDAGLPRWKRLLGLA